MVQQIKKWGEIVRQLHTQIQTQRRHSLVLALKVSQTDQRYLIRKNRSEPENMRTSGDMHRLRHMIIVLWANNNLKWVLYVTLFALILHIFLSDSFGVRLSEKLKVAAGTSSSAWEGEELLLLLLVTKSVTWRYLDKQAWYHRSAGVKTTENKF